MARVNNNFFIYTSCYNIIFDAAPSLSNLKLNGAVVYDENKDVNTFGLYSFSAQAPVTRKEVTLIPRLSASGGAIYSDGKLYVYDYAIDYGYVSLSRYAVYDAVTGAELDYKSMGYSYYSRLSIFGRHLCISYLPECTRCFIDFIQDTAIVSLGSRTGRNTVKFSVRVTSHYLHRFRQKGYTVFGHTFEIPCRKYITQLLCLLVITIRAAIDLAGNRMEIKSWGLIFPTPKLLMELLRDQRICRSLSRTVPFPVLCLSILVRDIRWKCFER